MGMMRPQIREAYKRKQGVPEIAALPERVERSKQQEPSQAPVGIAEMVSEPDQSKDPKRPERLPCASS